MLRALWSTAIGNRSTDYDTSDRLYFEPLTQEDVLELLACEMASGELLGVIVQFGGQTPLKLSQALERAGIPILGTSPDAIDLAKTAIASKTCSTGLPQTTPQWHCPQRRGSPRHCRRYRFSGRHSAVLRVGRTAMEIVSSDAQLDRYMREAVIVSGDSPVLIDGYLRDATELDVDVLCDGDELLWPVFSNISKKPVCIRATVPAPCRRIRFRKPLLTN